MAMNSFPFFAVPNAEAFYAQTRAAIPDPATGKPTAGSPRPLINARSTATAATAAGLALVATAIVAAAFRSRR